MFCTDCGTKNPDDGQFCISCGKLIRKQAFNEAPPPPPPPPVHQQQYIPPPVPPVQSSPKRMNKSLYMIFAAGGLILGTLLTVWGAADSKVEELLYFSWLPIIPGIVALYVMVYKMWAAIQDGQARTTPGKAVGFMFIPLFNLYWFFQVFYGWAKDYNGYVTRHNLNVPKVSENTFLIYTISSLFCFPLAIVMLFVVISKVCDAVNGLTANYR